MKTAAERGYNIGRSAQRRGTREFISRVPALTIPLTDTNYGRGGGVVGRALGVGEGLTTVAVGVGVGVNVAVAVAVAVGVNVAVAVGVAVGVRVAVGVGVAPPQIPSVSEVATVVEPL